MIKRKYLIVLIIALRAFVSNANMTKPDTVICPIDGEKIIFRITTGMNTWSSFADLEKIGMVGDYYYQFINACPKCHFAGYIQDFQKKYSEEEINKLKNFIAQYANRNMDEVNECIVAAEILQFQNSENRSTAYAYLLASYRLRKADSLVSKRKEVQRKVIDSYLLALQKNEFDKKEIATTFYLVAEMYRRLGEFDKAIEYFKKALTDKKKEKWIKKSAPLLMDLAEKKDEDNFI